ncbi:MAG: ACT domain-containing protein [Oscillospiraceae bacterium]|nr:ACT domain-containing protein [Oscillospiraceae bacterium]
MHQAEQKFYLVEAAALPEVLLKVLAVKELLEAGSAKTVAEAVTQVRLSRSAFYKYRDAISPFFDASSGRIITFHVLLKNRPGALSAVLGIFSNFGANILTINQSIPVRGRAVVTISAETHRVADGLDRLLAAAAEHPEVIRIEVMAG